jgi:hypothetical protein
VTDDDLPSSETLRSRRADRRARRAAILRAKRAFARRLFRSDAVVERWVRRNAETTRCSCVLCRPHRHFQTASASELRRIASVASELEET